MSQTITEKVAQAHAVEIPAGQELRAGDIVTIRPFHLLTHDNTGAILQKFEAIGAGRVADPSQPVFALDHNVQDTTDSNLAKYQAIEAFAIDQGIAFHPAGAGIGHQLMMENGFVHPGSLVVASDSHSNMYGALAAIGTPVVRTDAAAIWATGRTWWQIPRTVKVVLEGGLRAGVVGKDVIITLCGLYSSGEVLNAAVEFHGPGIGTLSISERMTIANMTTEWGALVGWFPYDAVTALYLREREARLTSRGLGHRLTRDMLADWSDDPPAPDPDAEYAAEIVLDLSQVSPHVAGPDSVAVAQPVTDFDSDPTPVHKAYLLSCVNSRFDDLFEAAEILRGKRINDGVELYVAAASAEIEHEARAKGVWDILVNAGAKTLPPGCGACIGLGVGLLEAGEVGISATNRNFKGRMGSRDAKAFLASPAVVAASALAGRITGPSGYGGSVPEYLYRNLERKPPTRSVEIQEGFPSALDGRALLLPVDHLNTDGIYGKDVTYRDDLTTEEMATHAMANYDPGFQEIAADGDIIVAGRSFGSGSSREQAATSLKYRGVRMVIAASFSQTYLRNAFNNAFVCVESPALFDAMLSANHDQAQAGEKTIPAGDLSIDYRRSVATWRGSEYQFSPVGPAAQELILAGGLEALTRKRLGL